MILEIKPPLSVSAAELVEWIAWREASAEAARSMCPDQIAPHAGAWPRGTARQINEVAPQIFRTTLRASLRKGD